MGGGIGKFCQLCPTGIGGGEGGEVRICMILSGVGIENRVG